MMEEEIMCKNHLRLQVIGVVAILAGGVMAAPREDSAPREPATPERESALDYASSHPLVLKDAGTVSRNDDETWEVSMGSMRQPVSFKPAGGRTDIPRGSVLSGTVLLGAHGPFMALIIETEDGETFSAAMEFVPEELAAAIGPKSELRGVEKSDPSLQDLPGLQRTTIRLMAVDHFPGAMAPFGAFFASSEDTNTGGSAEARCTCFLACSVSCDKGQDARCECQFLGINTCECITVEVK